MSEAHRSEAQPAAEAAADAAVALPEPTAGGLLRAAREAQGMHVTALAAAIKVTPRKLEALEDNRLADLPDATFARALAQTICRHLKIDAKPVLALLPAHGAVALEPASRMASTPYRESNGRVDHKTASHLGPLVWGAAVLLVAAAGIALAPPDWGAGEGAPEPAVPPAGPSAASAVGLTTPAASTALPAPATAAEAAVVAGAASSALNAASGAATVVGVPGATAQAGAPQLLPPQTVASGLAAAPGAPARDGPAAAETVFATPPVAAGATPAAAGVLVVTTSDASWLEVRDAKGRVLLSEIVQPGRTVGLDGALPMRLLVGNAAATQVVFQGKTVDVLGRARDNVARFELQ